MAAPHKPADPTLAGLLGSDDAFRADGNRVFGGLEIQIQQNAVIYFSLGEQNLPFVQLLLAFFSGLTARVLGALTLLRFEANFGLTLLGS